MANSAETCCNEYYVQTINVSRQLTVMFNYLYILSQKDKMNKI